MYNEGYQRIVYEQVRQRSTALNFRNLNVCGPNLTSMLLPWCQAAARATAAPRAIGVVVNSRFAPVRARARKSAAEKEGNGRLGKSSGTLALCT